MGRRLRPSGGHCPGPGFLPEAGRQFPTPCDWRADAPWSDRTRARRRSAHRRTPPRILPLARRCPVRFSMCPELQRPCGRWRQRPNPADHVRTFGGWPRLLRPCGNCQSRGRGVTCRLWPALPQIQPRGRAGSRRLPNPRYTRSFCDRPPAKTRPPCVRQRCCPR